MVIYLAECPCAMWGEEICLRQYVIESDDVFSMGGKDMVRYTRFPHRGSHSLNNNCCILLSDCISWVIFCEQRIGSLGALEMCLWFPLLPNEIWYALLLQISVEFTTCKKWFCRLDFYLERWSIKRYWMPAFSHSHALSSVGFQVKSVGDRIPYCSWTRSNTISLEKR